MIIAIVRTMIIVSGKQFKLKAALTATEVAGREASPATIPAGAVNRGSVTLGLWGTSNPKRVAVTSRADDPELIVGYVREVSQDRWRAEGDPAENLFSTPREAADFAFLHTWKI